MLLVASLFLPPSKLVIIFYVSTDLIISFYLLKIIGQFIASPIEVGDFLPIMLKLDKKRLHQNFNFSEANLYIFLRVYDYLKFG